MFYNLFTYYILCMPAFSFIYAVVAPCSTVYAFITVLVITQTRLAPSCTFPLAFVQLSTFTYACIPPARTSPQPRSLPSHLLFSLSSARLLSLSRIDGPTCAQYTSLELLLNRRRPRFPRVTSYTELSRYLYASADPISLRGFHTQTFSNVSTSQLAWQ